MTLAVKPWPKRLMDCTKHRARLKREAANFYGRIPAGTIGTLGNASRWTDLTFTADPCDHCGQRLSVSGLTKDALELITDEAML